MDDPAIPTLHQLGHDRGRGNLLGIEPYMIPQDYSSAGSFFDKLSGYLLAAQRGNWLNEKTVVLVPEHIGTWLVVAGEGMLNAATLLAAERSMVFRHPFKFGARYLTSTERGRAEAAFFRMKANQMAGIYHDVFSRLARTFAVTIIAGSITLPAPHISSGRLIPNNGPLRNASVVYRPDGAPHLRLIFKSFPTSKELPFITPAAANDLPSFETPAGRLGVLICADSWYPQAYLPEKAQGIDILTVPSYDVFGMQNWNRIWPGYDGWPAPPDVDPGDIGKIAESQAWQKYSLTGRIRSSGATYGMNVFLRGRLWDQDLAGWPATLVRGEEVFVEEQTQKAALLSLWL
jgi:hypothetical protein